MLNQRQLAPGWALRPAHAADAPDLARLCAAHAAYEQMAHEPEGHAERLAQALKGERLRAWICLLNGQPVGYASATLDFATLTAQPFLHLDCLYLEPTARGQGLGGELLEAVASCARALGCAQLQWQTPAWNAPAMRFYDRLGATRLEKQRYTLVL
ncbi:MAG TPA: GNAT family N-acetyltransferase [Hydrogenophaga sp.]|nr:GNAT family N-acetyltransferase [Hydrogenophaga sp.]